MGRGPGLGLPVNINGRISKADATQQPVWVGNGMPDRKDWTGQRVDQARKQRMVN